jgi:hypothetical protein
VQTGASIDAEAKGTLNIDSKPHHTRVSSQPDKDTIAHEAEVKGSQNMKINKQNLAQNINVYDSKAKKKCKYLMQF